MKYSNIFAITLIAFSFVLLLPSPILAADTTPPETEVFFEPEIPAGNNNWYIQPVEVTLVATDLETGVSSINYKLDDNDWQSEEFLDTLNLVQNPSFETGNYWWISKWDHPYYPWWQASLRQSFVVYKFGDYSARIFSYSNGWYYWTNEDYYAVTDPYKLYSVTVWIKTWDFWGTGAHFKVWAKNSNGADELLVESGKVTGTQDWEPMTETFYMPEGYDGVYLQLGSEGFGFVFWDGVDLHEEQGAQYKFSVAEDGIHNLLYYSADRAQPPNTEEPQGPVSFKIDTGIPTNWRDFEGIRQSGYNDHTFDVSVTVSDYISGFDINTAYYTYSADGGDTWSDWLAVDTYDPSEDGVQDVTITAEAVDFVNSNWQIEKLIQFKIADMAGLSSYSPVMSINAPWIKFNGGDLYAQNGISLNGNPLLNNATGLAVSSGGIEGVSTTNGWLLENYFTLDKKNYMDWLPDEEPVALHNELPEESGIFIIGRDFIINNQAIPASLIDTSNLAIVIFVDGDLKIHEDLELHDTSGLLFIVSGGVRIKNSVERVDASFSVDEEFDTSYTPGTTKPLSINGIVAADSFNLKRILKHSENQTTPAETINFQPKFFFLMQDYVGEVKYTWIEK